MPRSHTLSRRALSILTLTVALMAGGAVRAQAQDTTRTANLRPTPEGQILVLTLVDGSVLQGRVLDVTPTSVRFLSALGETVIPRSAIARIGGGMPTGDGRSPWPEDPSSSRLFFAPTGRMLRSGEKYFSDAYVLLPSFQVGLSNSFSLGGGMSIIPFVPVEDQVFYLTPKLGVVSGPNLNVSVGAVVAGAQVASDYSPFGIVYGVATLGGEDASVTAGGGVVYSRTQAASNALLMLGGSRRVSRSIALVTENYFYTGVSSSTLLSGGVRFIGDKLSVDLAGIVFAAEPTFPLPFISFIYKY